MSDNTGEKGFSVDMERQEMKSIVLEHRVFWGTLSIELPDEEGHRVKVGMSVALVGTDPDTKTPGDQAGKSATFDRLMILARWLTTDCQPGIRFDIRRHDNVVFYQPDDLRTKRNNYVVVIRILHSEQFNSPMNEAQLQTLQEIQKKLKDIGSPQERWKEPNTTL
jgi:hypothetical protein